MDTGEFQGRMTRFAEDTERRLGGIETKLDDHGERLAKIEVKIDANGNGKKAWPKPITLSLGAGGALALGGALVKIAEIVFKHTPSP